MASIKQFFDELDFNNFGQEISTSGKNLFLLTMTGKFLLVYPFPTKVNRENEGVHYSACSNSTSPVSVIVLVIFSAITHQSTMALPISKTLACYYTQDDH